MAKVTGQFGEKRSYYKPGKFHEGVDLAFDLNAPIKAYSGGTVSKIGFDPFGYGRYIKIKSPDGAEQIYAHANKIHKKVGDLINLGDEIGLVGSTGRSTGPHLHFGNYINGKAVNPMNLVNGLPPITPVLGKANVSTNNDDVINEYAKNYLAKNQELEARKLALQENNLKIINDILSQPQQRITPVSLEEVLLAPKGEKLATYAQYMKSPEWKKSMGNLFGTYRFDPKSGDAVGLGDEMAAEAEQGYANLQKAAAAQNKSRNDMVLELMKEFGVNDRFDKDLGFKYDKQAQDYEISKEKNNIEKAYKEGLITNAQKELLIKESEAKEKVRHNKAAENIALEKIDTNSDNSGVGKTTSGNNKNTENSLNKKTKQPKMSTNDAKQLSENRQTIAAIDRGIKSISKNPNAYSWAYGKLGPDITNRIDPAGVQTRSEIDNITAVYRKWLTGAQMSDKERKDYERFLPAPTDNGKIVKAKLQAMRNSIVEKNRVIENQYNTSGGNDPMGIRN